MNDSAWWQHGIVYQIYPRSFQDSNGDGIGDLNGIRARLHHLVNLGVDAIWISPIFLSPMADFGYDVADYCGIHPIFGTLADFDALVAEAHRLGLRVILDFVPNHSSDRNAWFAESKASRQSPKRDWYIWRDPGPNGGPPTNWLSNFGGPAWTFDPSSGQYYYHAFLSQQPDLNWRNPEVRAAMYDVLRFWMRRGVDGFRVDVIWHLMKDAEFRDNPPNPSYRDGSPEIDRLVQLYSADQPEIHDVIAEMRSVIDEFPERVLIGEIYLPLERLVAYYGENLSGAHLPFNFQLIQAAWNAKTIAAMIEDYEQALPQGGWPNWVLGNHDKSRIATRVGAGQARVAAMLLLTLRGTPTLYYGDEIGMEDVHIPEGQEQDPWERNEPGLGFGRDPQRTPMQWDASANAGFTTGRPWLPLGPDHEARNVAALADHPASILALYTRLIRLRRENRALGVGGFRLIPARGDDVLAFERTLGEERIGVFLNLGHTYVRATLADDAPAATVLLSTSLAREDETLGNSFVLQPNEGVIVRFGR